MKRVVVFLFTAVFVQAVTFCQAPPEIPIAVKHDKTMVTLTIDGVTIPDMILDTGFSYDGILIYNPEIRDKLDLKDAANAKIGGAGSGKDSEALVKNSSEIKAGSVKLPEQMIIFITGDDFKGFPSSGAIGYSLFGHFVTEIDYDKSVLVLHEPGFKPDVSWTELPIYFKDNMVPWIDVQVAVGKDKPVKLSAYVDLAASTPIVLIEKKGMKFKPPEKTEESILGRGLSGDVKAKTCQIKTLIIGPYELTNVDAAIAPQSHSKQKGADAVLGCGALNHFNFILDYQNRKIYLKPNKGGH